MLAMKGTRIKGSKADCNVGVRVEVPANAVAFPFVVGLFDTRGFEAEADDETGGGKSALQHLLLVQPVVPQTLAF